MRHPARLAPLMALVVGLTIPSAAEVAKKPAAAGPGVAQAGAPANSFPKPDFQAWADDQYIFVVNYGDADYTGPLDIEATCRPPVPQTLRPFQTATPDNSIAAATLSARPSPLPCGANFNVNRRFSYHVAHFPAGHGNAPTKGAGNAQQTSGSGWLAVFMGLPKGDHEIEVIVDPKNKVAEKDESNNKSVKMITIK